MNNDSTEFKKGQEVFKDLISLVYTGYKSFLLKKNESSFIRTYKYLGIGNGIRFIPQLLSLDEEKGKVKKTPLVSKGEKLEGLTKNQLYARIERVEREFEERRWGYGVAVFVTDFQGCIIDIDDVNKFEEWVGKNINQWIEEVKGKCCLIVKTLSGGYHIYLGVKAQERLRVCSVNNKSLLDNYGFELKKVGLITLPGSKYNDKHRCEVVHINKDKWSSDEGIKEIEELLQRLELEEFLRQEQEKRKREIEKLVKAIKNNEKKKGRGKKKIDFEAWVEEVKKTVKFEDLLGTPKIRSSYYYSYCCPFHEEKNPSFSVKVFSDFEIATDWHDGEKYDIIKFYMKYYNKDFYTALKEISERFGINTPYENISKEEKIEAIKEEVKEEKVESEDEKKVKVGENVEGEEGERVVVAGKGKLTLERFQSEAIKTRRTIYSEPIRHLSGGKAIRVVMDLKRKRIYTVVQEVKFWENRATYELDKEVCYEVLKVNEKWGDEEGREEKKQYLYLTFNIKEKLGYFAFGKVVNYTDTEEYDVEVLVENKEKKRFEGCKITDIADFLYKDALLVKKNGAEYLSHIVQAMQKLNLVQVKKELARRGFFYDKERDKITVGRINVSQCKVKKEEVRELLRELNLFVEKHYSHTKDKFATTFKWFLVSAFNRVIKEFNNSEGIPYLYLYGDSSTGKTVMAKFCQSVWGEWVLVNNEDSADSFRTPARLRENLSRVTFPHIVGEPAELINNIEIREMLKQAVTSMIVGRKFMDVRTAQGLRDFHSLSSICFTSNHYVPDDAAFLRRCYLIVFTEKDIEGRKYSVDEFKKDLIRLQKKIYKLGFYVVSEEELLQKMLELIKKHQNDFNRIGEEFLREIYASVGLEHPDWILAKCEKEIDLDSFRDERKSDLITFIWQKILESTRFERNIKTREERIALVLKEWRIRWLIMSKGDVLITKEILSEIKGFPSLSVIGDALGYKVETRHLNRKGKVNTNKRGVVIPYADFINLFPDDEENEEIEKAVTQVRERNITLKEMIAQSKAAEAEVMWEKIEEEHRYLNAMEEKDEKRKQEESILEVFDREAVEAFSFEN